MVTPIRSHIYSMGSGMESYGIVRPRGLGGPPAPPELACPASTTAASPFPPAPRRCFPAGRQPVPGRQPAGRAPGERGRWCRGRGSRSRPRSTPRVISDCHFAVQLTHFIPGFLGLIFSRCFAKVTIGCIPPHTPCSAGQQAKPPPAAGQQLA